MRSRFASLLRAEQLRFGLVGAVNTAVDLGIYVLLQLSGMPAVAANLISTSAGLGVSFVANRTFTFSARPSASPGRQLLLFVSCTGVGLWLLQPVVILTTSHLLASATRLGDARIVIGKLLAIAVGMAWNWTIYSRVVFRPSGPSIASVADPGSATVIN